MHLAAPSALAWCTQRARGTIDIDVNVFLPIEELDRVLDGLPAPVRITESDRATFRRDGQARLWWDTTPVDVFLNTDRLPRTRGGPGSDRALRR